jgi:hypothetical protein
MLDNIQNCDSYINMPSSETYRSYLSLLRHTHSGNFWLAAWMTQLGNNVESSGRGSRGQGRGMHICSCLHCFAKPYYLSMCNDKDFFCWTINTFFNQRVLGRTHKAYLAHHKSDCVWAMTIVIVYKSKFISYYFFLVEESVKDIFLLHAKFQGFEGLTLG